LEAWSWPAWRCGGDPVLAAETAEPLAALVGQPLWLLDAVAAALEP
jgi:hypothetical protein